MDESTTPKNGTNASPPLAEMLGKLLSDPEMRNRIGAVLGSTIPSATTSTPPKETEEAVQAAVSTASPTSGGGTDGLAALLSNPEILSQLPQIMSVMKQLPAFTTPPKGNSGAHDRSPADCRNDLLLSLKPFLSSHRRDAVDSILQLAKLGAVLKLIK